MKPLSVKPRNGLRGIAEIPGDKSISHRAIIAASLAKGKTEINNFLFSDDCLATLNALKKLGVKFKIQKKKSRVTVFSSGVLRFAQEALDMRESGTSARILMGLLSAQPFSSRLIASDSLLKRPMARVIRPLRIMGAKIVSKRIRGDEFLPVKILPSALRPIKWIQQVASAQVKSAILLAGLFAGGETVVQEPVATRDHTERMLKLFAAKISSTSGKIRVLPGKLKTPGKVYIPGDISSSMFFIVAALLTKDSKVIIKNVGINPTRSGALDVLKRMGAKIKITNVRKDFEPYADIEASTSSLKGVKITSRQVPSLIDELPIVMVAASLAKGKTVINGAQELKVKETDRILALCTNLSKLGVNVEVKALKNEICIEIQGSDHLAAAKLMSFHDHRTAMSMFVAALASNGTCLLDDISCVNKSFPSFLPNIRQLYE